MRVNFPVEGDAANAGGFGGEIGVTRLLENEFTCNGDVGCDGWSLEWRWSCIDVTLTTVERLSDKPGVYL